MSATTRSQLANMAKQAKAALQADKLEAVADRGYFDGEEILACDEAGITVTLPKPMTSGCKVGRPVRQAGLRLYLRARMSIVVRPGSISNTTSRPLSGDKLCAAIGRTHVKAAL